MWRELEVHGYLWLQSKSGASLGYMDKNKDVVIGCLIVNHLGIEFNIEMSTGRISLISAEKDLI